MITPSLLVLAASFSASHSTEFVPAPSATHDNVIDVWQQAADGDPVWTQRALHAQAAYDALCAKESSGDLDGVCRSLADQARCGLVRGLKPKSVAVARDGKTAELVVKAPGDELAVFLVKELKVGKEWKVDGVRCPATLDKARDNRPAAAPVKAAMKLIKP